MHLPPFKHFSLQIPVKILFQEKIYTAMYRSTLSVLTNHQQYVRFMSHVPRASQMIDRMVRVDHAGELGADRIYAGQLAVLGKNFVKFESIDLLKYFS